MSIVLLSPRQYDHIAPLSIDSTGATDVSIPLANWFYSTGTAGDVLALQPNANYWIPRGTWISGPTGRFFDLNGARLFCNHPTFGAGPLPGIDPNMDENSTGVTGDANMTVVRNNWANHVATETSPSAPGTVKYAADHVIFTYHPIRDGSIPEAFGSSAPPWYQNSGYGGGWPRNRYNLGIYSNQTTVYSSRDVAKLEGSARTALLDPNTGRWCGSYRIGQGRWEAQHTIRVKAHNVTIDMARIDASFAFGDGLFIDSGATGLTLYSSIPRRSEADAKVLHNSAGRNIIGLGATAVGNSSNAQWLPDTTGGPANNGRYPGFHHWARHGYCPSGTGGTNDVAIDGITMWHAGRWLLEVEPVTAPGSDGLVVKNNYFGDANIGAVFVHSEAQPLKNFTFENNRALRTWGVQGTPAAGAAHSNWIWRNNIHETDEWFQNNAMHRIGNVNGIQVYGNNGIRTVSRGTGWHSTAPALQVCAEGGFWTMGPGQTAAGDGSPNDEATQYHL
jgi:hypothetical protein